MVISSSKSDMSACLYVRLLGLLEISWDGRSLPKPATLKSQSLLAYLIHDRKMPQPRNHLCNLHWVDFSTSKARGSLSTALWQIHRCLPAGEFILSDSETIQFNPEMDVWLDVDEFVSCVSSEDVDSMSSGIELYRGDFLNGFYDDWTVDERYQLEGLYCSTLARLMASQESAGKYNQAFGRHQRLIGCDPLPSQESYPRR
jgi:DNA-binding SARP family transcriptional activator